MYFIVNIEPDVNNLLDASPIGMLERLQKLKIGKSWLMLSS